MWLAELRLKDVRNIESATLELGPGVNVFVGRNAQGKTSLLEAVGLLARGRSFRTEDTRAMIRRGAERLHASAATRDAAAGSDLDVELSESERVFRLNGRAVEARDYRGRLEVAVYSGDRVRAIRGPMRERRLYLDRGAAAIWPAYHRLERDFARTLQQRNAALRQRSREIEAWDERFARLGGELRCRRAHYARLLSRALERGFRPSGEAYSVAVAPDESQASASDAAERLRREQRQRRGEEFAAGRSLVGPHRDEVAMTVDGQDGALASSGQARSLLLALTLATLDVFETEQGSNAVALLDDLDSELDEPRTEAVVARFGTRGQALVTTAHAAWPRALQTRARLFAVEGGRVVPMRETMKEL